jgi:adenosylhomocysteine nucleosidase
MRMQKPIALVAAMREELDALLVRFPAHDARTHFNTPLYHARHNGQDLVITQSGVGKVNAACTLTLLLSDFNPGCVINTGCAGGLGAGQRILDLAVPEQVAYTDVDITPLGFEYGQMMGSAPRFNASLRLLTHLRAVLDGYAPTVTCHHGLLGSSDAFIHQREQIERIRRHFGDAVRCVDMEGGAIAHACTRFNVPFLILRVLSDLPEQGGNAPDFQAFLTRASALSADLCRNLVNRLALQESL